MKNDKETILKRYQQLTDEVFSKINPDELSNEGRSAYHEEKVRRSSTDYKEKKTYRGMKDKESSVFSTQRRDDQVETSMSDTTRNLLNLLRRTLAGFSLGLAFVIIAILAYKALYVLGFLEAAEKGVPFNPTNPEPGFESRVATYLLWMFLGAYLSGFLLCSPKTGEAQLAIQYPRLQIAVAMLLSAGVMCLAGWIILENANLYCHDLGGSLLSFFMGLVLGLFLYVWLSDRLTALFSFSQHNADQEEKEES